MADGIFTNSLIRRRCHNSNILPYTTLFVLRYRIFILGHTWVHHPLRYSQVSSKHPNPTHHSH